eukprot:660608-Rhodomonas_salina.1
MVRAVTSDPLHTVESNKGARPEAVEHSGLACTKLSLTHEDEAERGRASGRGEEELGERGRR